MPYSRGNYEETQRFEIGAFEPMTTQTRGVTYHRAVIAGMLREASSAHARTHGVADARRLQAAEWLLRATDEPPTTELADDRHDGLILQWIEAHRLAMVSPTVVRDRDRVAHIGTQRDALDWAMGKVTVRRRKANK